jgi:hypothetical protein
MRFIRIAVLTEPETMIFNSWSDNIKDLKFDDTLGGQVGTDIKLSQKTYKIEAFQIITDMTTDSPDIINDKFLFQINIFVSPNN